MYSTCNIFLMENYSSTTYFKSITFFHSKRKQQAVPSPRKKIHYLFFQIVKTKFMNGCKVYSFKKCDICSYLWNDRMSTKSPSLKTNFKLNFLHPVRASISENHRYSIKKLLFMYTLGVWSR